jgi:hypothetical protein
VQRIEMSGVYPTPPVARLVVWGIHGGSEFVTGLQIGTTYIERRGSRIPIAWSEPVWSGETCDELRLRAINAIAPTLPADALRDSKGAVVGYFVYQNLPPDHCKAVAEREGRL